MVIPDALLRSARPWLVAIVLVHAIVAGWHGFTHLKVPVPLASWQEIYVAVVILLLPIIGAGLLWTRRIVLGCWIIALSMLGALIFGFAFHYVIHSPDHVAFLAPGLWRDPFIISAALVLATEAMGAATGIIVIALEYLESE